MLGGLILLVLSYYRGVKGSVDWRIWPKISFGLRISVNFSRSADLIKLMDSDFSKNVVRIMD